jgi:hypothetical protein
MEKEFHNLSQYNLLGVVHPLNVTQLRSQPLSHLNPHDKTPS